MIADIVRWPSSSEWPRRSLWDAMPNGGLFLTIVTLCYSDTRHLRRRPMSDVWCAESKCRLTAGGARSDPRHGCTQPCIGTMYTFIDHWHAQKLPKIESELSFDSACLALFCLMELKSSCLTEAPTSHRCILSVSQKT